ncbi:hypothetical protein B0H34DRAFT_437216 [Crassisporium funariophilum]|nr:hypothetical protein B0H34DRAFT_437216 [Crassisporium funariophilum]
MGPPTVPAPLSGGHTAQSPPDAGEKYKKLKRRFFELEEETRSELHRSGERNVRMREERDNLLERMLDLEKTGVAQSSNGSPTLSSTTPSVPMAQLSSSSYPRTLRNPKARTSFVANLREAAAEDDADDDLDPLLTSRHLGPQARRRDEEERRDRGDEEGWEPRNGGHRRGSLSGDAASISSADYNQPSSSTSIRGLALQSPPTNHSHPPMHSPHQRRSLTPDQHNGNGYKPDSSVAGDNDVDMDEGGSGYDNLSGPQGYTQRSSGTPNRRDLHELGYVEGQADGRGSPAFSVRSEAASTASNTVVK